MKNAKQKKNMFSYFTNHKNALCKQKIDPYSRLTYSSWVSRRFFKNPSNLSNLVEFFNSITNIKIIPADSNSHSLFFTSELPFQIINSNQINQNNQNNQTKQNNRDSSLWHEQLNYYNPKLFVKMSLTYDFEHKFKEIEPIIYTNIINRMLQEYRSPHFMLYLGHQFIINWNPFIETYNNEMSIQVRQQIFDNFTRKFADELNDPVSQGGHLLVLECGQGMDWDKFLDQLTFYPTREFYKLMFQILYTLWTMDLVGLTHYDLHAGNIFLEQIEQCNNTEMIYIINSNECIQIDQPIFMARLYDWDYGYLSESTISESTLYRSTKSKPKSKPESTKRLNNQELHDIKKSRSGWLRKETGNDNRHFSYYDVFKVFITLLRHKKTPEPMKQFIKKQFNYNNSKDPNLNLLLRIDYCLSSRGKPGACRSHDLCELVLNPKYGQWECRGPYQFRQHVMNDIKTIFVNFIQTFLSFNYFKKISKRQFKSGSLNVYCPDPQLRNSWRKNK